MTQTHIPTNWNVRNDDYTQMFWEANIRNFWVDTEIPVSSDKNVWFTLSKSEKDVFKKVLAGLTLLDTEQSNVGMPLISQCVTDLQQKAVLNFMSMAEAIHHKSYSTIFTTLISSEDINEVFAWVEKNPRLQRKAEIITRYYRRITDNYSLYMAKVSSVFLETFAFFSGFYYPLYLAGQGKMTASGEIINLIIRDEAVHGVFVGLLAQETYAKLTLDEQKRADAETLSLLETLYDIEKAYTEEVYEQIGLTDDVLRFVRYNANKALMNLGRDTFYPDEPVNPIVLNGLRTETKTHDFFSVNN